MESLQIPEIVRIVSNLSLAVPLAIYISRIRSVSREIHIIGALLVVSGICDLIGFILFSRQESTVILINTYYAILFFLLNWFYYEVLFANKQRVLVWTGIVVYVIAFVLVSAYVQKFTEYQTLMWLITAVIMILYSIAYFFHSLSLIVNEGVFGSSLVWINIGVMLYFILNLFLFVMGNHLLTNLDPGTSAMIWSSHNMNNILKNLLFAIGIYCGHAGISVPRGPRSPA